MNALDSPLEALAFNYATFGFSTVVNNIWTWIAVLTAAVSVWTIRATGSPKSEPRIRNPDVSPPKAVLPPPDKVAELASASASTSTSAPLATMSPSVFAVESDGATKGKFSVYYEDDRDHDGEGADGELDDDEDLGSVVAVDGGEWFDGWDTILRMRKGEMGWYRFQDTTVLDGNVVRLWDGECRLRKSIEIPADGWLDKPPLPMPFSPVSARVGDDL
ncbi:hypothetical protein F0562_009781 [Nyssa sinensis]|uniref:Uncharacterized protein n=1 Tax=Nyssa sinensis TaxID=561372 RepID=A0A5J5A079_9ASTE|nr:hypothetical protein F0562_009781 [Nyssa sinensis]